MKRILIIHASARVNGNTAYLTKVAKEAAEAAGNEVTVIEATKLKIQPCRDCKTCFKTGRPCTFNDDFDDIVAPELERSDAIVFVEPMYWFEAPAAMRLIVDKFYAYETTKHPLPIKTCALIATRAGDLDLDGIVIPYEHTVKLMGWTNVGTVTQGLCINPGDVEKTDAPARVRELMGKL